jgi:hypothetical protein
MKTEQEWAEAKSHIDEIRRLYFSIGVAGIPALRMVIDPLLIRFENGERTDDLFDDIMKLEE